MAKVKKSLSPNLMEAIGEEGSKENRKAYKAKLTAPEGKVVNMTFRVSKEVHQILRDKASEGDTNIQQLLMEALDLWHPGIFETK